MASDAAVKGLLSRRRVGRSEAWLLALAAIALATGAAAWVSDSLRTTSLATAALPESADLVSFEDRFASLRGEAVPADLALRPLERNGIDALRDKVREAKALLSSQLRSGEWRWTLAEEDQRPVAEEKPVKSDIPLPRSRPAAANLEARVASAAGRSDGIPAEENRTLLQKLSDLFPAKMRLASLTPDSGLFGRGPDLAALGFDRQTAVYDITARAVYLPSGVKLEAHSGLGSLRDDPDHVHEPNVGATPPATYELRPREKLFHGVRALRMLPTEGSSTLGRVGLLTHSYMLGPNGDSNGCVSIKEYERFLKAYDEGEITRIVVVPSLKGTIPVAQRASSDS